MLEIYHSGLEPLINRQTINEGVKLELFIQKIVSLLLGLVCQGLNYIHMICNKQYNGLLTIT